MGLRLPEPKDPPLVYECEWIDAAVYLDNDEANPPGMAPMRTVGYYYSREKKFVRLSSDYDPENGECRTPHIIPIVHIKKFTLLRGRDK